MTSTHWPAGRFFCLLASTGKTWKHGNVHPSGKFARYSEWTGHARIEHLVHFESGRHVGAFDSVDDAETAAAWLLSLGPCDNLESVKAIGKMHIREAVESHGGTLA